jgi:glycosyltransferase involved in cell wall biosynthesis
VNNVNDLEALARALPRSRITYLPPGIAPEEFKRDEAAGRAIRSKYSIPPDAPLLMTAARLRTGVKARSILYLLKSLALLTPRQPQPLLLIAGDGPEDEKLRAAAERFIPGRTIFAGRVDRSDMFRYYSAADIFVFPGIGESLGMVFLEAQACELPVVALDTAGVPQVVRRSTTALLVPEDDGRSMAHAIDALLSSAELRNRLGQKGREFIREERNLHRNYVQLSKILQDIRISGCR